MTDTDDEEIRLQTQQEEKAKLQQKMERRQLELLEEEERLQLEKKRLDEFESDNTEYRLFSSIPSDEQDDETQSSSSSATSYEVVEDWSLPFLTGPTLLSDLIELEKHSMKAEKPYSYSREIMDSFADMEQKSKTQTLDYERYNTHDMHLNIDRWSTLLDSPRESESEDDYSAETRSTHEKPTEQLEKEPNLSKETPESKKKKQTEDKEQLKRARTKQIRTLRQQKRDEIANQTSVKYLLPIGKNGTVVALITAFVVAVTIVAVLFYFFEALLLLYKSISAFDRERLLNFAFSSTTFAVSMFMIKSQGIDRYIQNRITDTLFVMRSDAILSGDIEETFQPWEDNPVVQAPITA